MCRLRTTQRRYWSGLGKQRVAVPLHLSRITYSRSGSSSNIKRLKVETPLRSFVSNVSCACRGESTTVLRLEPAFERHSNGIPTGFDKTSKHLLGRTAASTINYVNHVITHASTYREHCRS